MSTRTPLPGNRGTVDTATGAVHDTAGRYVTTLPAHTVALLAPVEAPTVTHDTKIRRLNRLTRWLGLA